MHNLIVAALQEGRIDRAERPQPAGRHTGAEGHAMLFGYAHVENTVLEPRPHYVDARACRHRGSDRDNRAVQFGLLCQGRTENFGIAGRIGARFGLRTAGYIEFRHAMAAVGTGFGRGVTFALHRADVVHSSLQIGKVCREDGPFHEGEVGAEVCEDRGEDALLKL